MLKLVPFNAAWIKHDKIDIHAIYRRPRFAIDKYGEPHRELNEHGLPTWDLTTPLPVRQHNRWIAKGFEYVTLANRESLIVAGRNNTIMGDWRQYDQHAVGGPWNYRLYQEGQEATYTAEADQLRRDVYEFGSAAVETLRRRTEPDFALPADLRGIAPDTPLPGVPNSGDSKLAVPGRKGKIAEATV